MTGHSQCGFLFDVSAKNADLAVHAVSFVPGAKDGDYDVYTVAESHERVHQNSKAWSLVAKGTHTGPRGCTLRVPLLKHVNIPRLSRHAFYISGHNVNAVSFSTDSNNTNSGENEDLTIHLGHFKAFPWEGVLSTGPFGHNGMQEFVGILEYEVLQAPASDLVMNTASRMWELRPFPDAELVAAGGRSFEVHRSVLAAASVQLRQAWENLPMTSATPALQIDAPQETVEALLRFIYTGVDETNTTPGEPLEMLRLAHQYGLPNLVRSSATRLANSMQRQNAVSLVRALRPYRDHPACELAWRTMLANVRLLVAEDSALLEEVCMSV